MILYRYMSKKQLEQWIDGKITEIDCTNKKNNDCETVLSTKYFMSFTTSAEELLIQRKNYKLSEAYLCNFKIPTLAIRKNAVKFEHDLNNKKFYFPKESLKVKYLNGYARALNTKNVDIVCDQNLGLIEQTDVHNKTPKDFRSK